MNRWKRVVALVAAAATLAVGAGCGDTDAAANEATPSKRIRQLEPGLVPSEMLGLTVTQEDQRATLDRAERSYVDAVGLYSFRFADLLQATLQVSRFNDNADFRSNGFRQALINQIGGSRPRPVRVGDETVYLTTATKQRIFIWFREQHLMILSTRDEYPQPRTLLREALEIQP